MNIYTYTRCEITRLHSTIMCHHTHRSTQCIYITQEESIQIEVITNINTTILIQELTCNPFDFSCLCIILRRIRLKTGSDDIHVFKIVSHFSFLPFYVIRILNMIYWLNSYPRFSDINLQSAYALSISVDRYRGVPFFKAAFAFVVPIFATIQAAVSLVTESPTRNPI